jgi:hypothetical protein
VEPINFALRFALNHSISSLVNVHAHGQSSEVIFHLEKRARSFAPSPYTSSLKNEILPCDFGKIQDRFINT